MIRHFGAAQYASVMTWPYRLIIRGAVIEGQRTAARDLARLRLQAVADGMEQGKKHVDPKNPNGGRKWDDPYYDLKPFNDAVQQLERMAAPWNWTDEAMIRRREQEEEREFLALERTMGRHSA